MSRVHRTGIIIPPNSRRVLFRPFQFSQEQRYLKIIARVLSLSEPEIEKQTAEVRREFDGRHQRLDRYFLRRFDQVRSYVPVDTELSLARRILIGAYFTMEYSLESAAVFNPSMVPHPDQSDVPEGSLRYIMSLRSVGEGHISSITFRSGLIGADGAITLDEDSPYVTSPQTFPDSSYHKPLFEKKLIEMESLTDFAAEVLSALDDDFTLEQLKNTLGAMRRMNRGRAADADRASRDILTLAQANYEILYTPDTLLSERVIFPYSPTESNGIEDARFVRFTDDGGNVVYYATYSAYDGKTVLSQILETTDFLHFRIATLNGPEVQNKGFALFPRRVNGMYAMISRQDNENIYIMFSDHAHFWYSKEILLKPTFPWEFVQLGNCGSPIETEAGWLVLSHGVGPMRKYSIGAFLLDRDDPTKVLGRTATPLLSPDENEREGYVPNVVYSCGAVLHGDTLVIPYAMSDYASSVATVPLKDVLEAMA